MEPGGTRRGADHNVMREVNRSLVLAVVKEGGRISRASIARATTLAKPTVSAIVDELIAEGLVREVGTGTTAVSGGRPPILLEFNASSHLVAGVHIGARRTTVAVGDATGAEVRRVRLDTPRGDPTATLKRIADQVRETAEVDGARLSAVGVVLPGLTDFHRGVCLLAPNLGWRDVAVGATLGDALGIPVYVHNAGQAAAVAENVEGVGDNAGELALLYAGTGLSAGVLSGGRVFHGAGGTAGEIGHCRVPGGTEPCNCGNAGCLETVASGPAMVRAVRRAIAAGRPSLLAGRRDLDASHVAAAARDGDTVAAAAIDEVGQYLGLAASWVVNAYNPAMLVLGGGLAAMGDLLLPPLREAFDASVLGPALRGVELRVSTLGDDAETRGAVLLALQHSETYYRVVFR
ncbi:transcriptional regulator [Virgisporangium aliadipatigenens]|uniref:Transcriptional regulator n=1 Tax=Virgisporangium aliadipatigenens TaxID=741659 RepID=A0A8J3YKD2_9ACTN|nr:ROK family transcriptional regulator [Virgisporangium aliadipatigenens]GIJ46954.1 transcriptional regulator [Virgisporangium aliadipatigenens]